MDFSGWIRPTCIMDGNLFYSKSVDLLIISKKYLHSNIWTGVCPNYHTCPLRIQGKFFESRCNPIAVCFMRCILVLVKLAVPQYNLYIYIYIHVYICAHSVSSVQNTLCIQILSVLLKAGSQTHTYNFICIPYTSSPELLLVT